MADTKDLLHPGAEPYGKRDIQVAVCNDKQCGKVLVIPA